jgi:hypothetical protein
VLSLVVVERDMANEGKLAALDVYVPHDFNRRTLFISCRKPAGNQLHRGLRKVIIPIVLGMEHLGREGCAVDARP